MITSYQMAGDFFIGSLSLSDYRTTAPPMAGNGPLTLDALSKVSAQIQATCRELPVKIEVSDICDFVAAVNAPQDFSKCSELGSVMPADGLPVFENPLLGEKRWRTVGSDGKTLREGSL